MEDRRRSCPGSFDQVCVSLPHLQASLRLPQVVGYSSEDQRRVSVHGTVGEFRRTFAFVGNRADRTEVSGNNCELLVSGVEWREVLRLLFAAVHVTPFNLDPFSWTIIYP